MSQKNYDLRIFTQLGLAQLEAEVYIAIINSGKSSTASSIAQIVNIARSEVYRTISGLEEFGLVKKSLTKPTRFMALPLRDGMSILLKQDEEKRKEKKEMVENFILNFKQKGSEKPSEEKGSYFVTHGLKAEKTEFERTIMKTKKTLDAIVDWGEFQKTLYTYYEFYAHLLRKGVVIRHIINVSTSEGIPKLIENLQKIGRFEVKIAQTPNAWIAIIDQKYVAILTSVGTNNKLQTLRSFNHDLIDLAQDYFDIKWQSALDCKIESIKGT